MKIKRLIASGIAVVAVLATTVLTAMPVSASSTLYLRPDGIGDETALTPVGATYNWQCVDEVTADEDTTHVVTDGTGDLLRDLYSADNTSQAGTINWVKIWIRATSGAEANTFAKTSIKTGEVAYDGDEIALTASYANYSTTYTNNPQTTVAWTWSDLNAVQIGVSLTGLYILEESFYSYCTQVWLEVNYTLSAPTVTTSAASNIDSTTATLNGNVTATGGENCTATVYWGATNGGTTPTNWTNNSTADTPSQPQGVAAFSCNITGLIKNTLYYFNAKGTNSQGTGWGTSGNFTTIGSAPSIVATSASNVAKTTTRLNSSITDDGGTVCRARFGYGTTNQTSGNFTSYDNFTDWTGYVYDINDTPYNTVTGLSSNTTYYYRAQVQNNKSAVVSTNEISFTTTISVGDITNFRGNPDADSIMLTWVLGEGATKALIRYRTDTFPTGTSDGTEVAITNLTSVDFTGLTSGKTYFMSAWGESGGAYSDNYTTLAMTTSLSSAAGDTMEAPPTDSSEWNQTPVATGLAKLGGFYDIANAFITSWGVEVSRGWEIGFMLFTALAGFFMWMKSGRLFPSLFVTTGLMLVGVVLHLMPAYPLAIMVAVLLGDYAIERQTA